MEEIIDKASNTETKPRHPWNKGKIIEAKPPLRAKHVWSIRTMLQIEGRKRDLALFNLAIDSKLRGCDVVSVKVEDVASRGYGAIPSPVPSQSCR
jgi:hypothetical protein